MYDKPRFLLAGDRALVVELGDSVEPETNRRVHTLLREIEGRGLPGTPGNVYAEWTQETIEPNWPTNIPASVGQDNARLQELLSDWRMEIFEVATDDKLKDRGLI